MIIHVRMKMFTGRPNPEWTIAGAEAQVLARSLEQLAQVQVVPAGQWRLGYKGLVLTVIDNGVVYRHVSVFDGLVEDVARRGPGRVEAGVSLRAQADQNRTLERRVYTSAPPAIIGDLGNMTFEQLTAAGNETFIVGVNPGGTPRQVCRSGPDPSRKSDWEALDAQNNCYRYANDALNTDIFAPVAMPGTLQLMPPAAATATVRQLFHQELVSDGLAPCPGDRVPDHCPSPGHLYLCVFLRHHHVTGNVTDYHCLRRDLDGTWSHLDGPFVRHDDDTLRPIVDLATAAFWHRPVLVGIYEAPLNNAKIA